ncbi:hypothetical protein SAMN05216410_3423 [Sanguibacter gelidistatuariae]|uniref:Aromatic ring-opening dioxygenase LigA n=1 Tax=Sanguibacter gelidistatuariae TaxID=1814289 RepID=A0A1G6VFB6_9MICO|nr:hypothetical protein [Sanguibacter gelidistatuariae]SDD52279.1 hypothetical protein SAMN05216410_3423 [Sanguibacter gelidistatuariae]
MSAAVVKARKPVAIIGILSMVAGLVLIIAGGVVWGVITSQLKAEEITVSAVTEEDPGALAGKSVAGPFTAFAQANAINHHALAASNNLTYAELGEKVTELKAADADGNADEIETLTAQRATVMNGSFLRASLFTSVVSYGVSALVMGLGLMFILIGWSLTELNKAKTAVVVAEERVALKV